MAWQTVCSGIRAPQTPERDAGLKFELLSYEAVDLVVGRGFDSRRFHQSYRNPKGQLGS